MAYCTLDNIQDVMDERDVIRYTDDSDSGVPDAGVVDRAIQSATALIDSYIARRYGTGLDPVPELIVSLAVDISVYKISSRKSQAPEDIRTNYEDAVRLLERISGGKADIPEVVVADEETVTENKSAVVVTRPQHFTGSALEDY